MRPLPRFSLGVVSRFHHESEAQLAAFERLAAEGVVVAPVWTASRSDLSCNDGRAAHGRAAAAVAARSWPHPWFLHADHQRPTTVDRSIDSKNFFTVDVSGRVGSPAADAEVRAFAARHPELAKPISVPGITKVIRMSEDSLATTARRYLLACRQAGEIFRLIRRHRGDDIVIEVSMDVADQPQTPRHLLVIMALLAEENIPLQAIAPAFASLFDKGADRVADPLLFEQEFCDDVAVCGFAASRYGLPETLKLSVRSGSDTVSLYPVIRRVLAASGAGVHLKTAGHRPKRADMPRAPHAIAIMAKHVTETLFERHLKPLFLDS